MSALSQGTSPAPLERDPLDVVILTNGPGEVATWVKPVVQSLRARSPDLRISVLLSPCPHASGQEASTLRRYPEVSRVQSAEHFLTFLLTGKTADNWDWHPQGVVVFLGGDQFYTVLVARRLGYRSVTYAEWDARWCSMIDRFGAMQAEVLPKVPRRYHGKFTVIGDLIADVQSATDRATITETLGCPPDTPLIGFLPGSKPVKLRAGVPLLLAIAQQLYQRQADEDAPKPAYGFVVGLAPNLTPADLLRYADPALNPAIAAFPCPPVELIEPPAGLPYLQIGKDFTGPKIYIWQRFPALDLYSQLSLCLTTVGANTAQLGALAIPMIVLLPTQQLDGLALLDGLPGLMARLPGFGAAIRQIITPLLIAAVKRTEKRFAWPNIWAKNAGKGPVVPERLGPITAAEISDLAQTLLTQPHQLEQIRQQLRQLRGPAGAADRLARIILETAGRPIDDSITTPFTPPLTPTTR